MKSIILTNKVPVSFNKIFIKSFTSNIIFKLIASNTRWVTQNNRDIVQMRITVTVTKAVSVNLIWCPCPRLNAFLTHKLQGTAG